MKRTILKVWMVTLVIILLYFNIGIQGMEDTSLNQKLLKKQTFSRQQTVYFDSNDHEEEDKENDDDNDAIDNIDKIDYRDYDFDDEEINYGDYDFDGNDHYDSDKELKEKYAKYFYSERYSNKSSPQTMKSFDFTQLENNNNAEDKIDYEQSFQDFEMEEDYNRLSKKQSDASSVKEMKKTSVYTFSKEKNFGSEVNIHTFAYKEMKYKNREKGMDWFNNLRQKDKDNAIQLLSQAIERYNGLNQDVLVDMESKFKISSAQTQQLYEFMYSKENFIDYDGSPNTTPKKKDTIKKKRSFKHFKRNRLPPQLQKGTTVLVQLEHPKDDFLKSVLVFANPLKYARPFWTNKQIKTKIKNFLKRNEDHKLCEEGLDAIEKLETMEKDGKQCIWKDGMKHIIQLIPDIFGINVAIYGMDRKFLKYIELNHPTTHLIYIISDGNGHFYPVRRAKDFKSEFATSNVVFGDNSVTFPPFNDWESTLSKNYPSILEDYNDLARAISISPFYNPYKDYREKIPSKREKLKWIKDTIKDYLTSETHEQHDITNYVQKLKNTHGHVPRYLKLKDHDIYGLAKCFDIYIPTNKEGWMKFDDICFKKIMENCRTFKSVDGQIIRNVKMTAIELMNFYGWYKHKLRISHKSIKKYTDDRKSMTLYAGLGTLVLVVIPCCSFWKSMYMRMHPGEDIYNIKLGHYPLLLFGYWSIFSFIYTSFVNPFLQHDIEEVNAIEYETNSGNCMTKCCKCFKYYGTGNWVDRAIFLQPLREFLVRAHDLVDAWLHARSLGSLMAVMFAVTTISYVCLEPIRSVFGLTRVIPPKFPFYKEFIHAPLELVKVFGLVFGGRTIGGFQIPNMEDVSDPGEFLSMTLTFYGTKMIVIFLLTPVVALTKLIRISFIAFGTAIADYSCCRPLVKGFKEWFHTKYNHEQGLYQFFKSNWKPILSQFGVILFFVFWEKVFTSKWIQEDLSYFVGVSGGLVVWDLFKYTTNMFNHQLHTISRSVPHNNEDGTSLAPEKGLMNFIKYYQTQIFLLFFTIPILGFYAHFGLDALGDIEYVGELGLEFFGIYMYALVLTNMYLLFKTLGSRCANYRFDDEDETEEEDE